MRRKLSHQIDHWPKTPGMDNAIRRLDGHGQKLLTDENAATRDPPRTAAIIRDLESLIPILKGALMGPHVKRVYSAIELIRLLEKETRP